MVSIKHIMVREKKYLLPEEKLSRTGAKHHDSDTVTDNHLLFEAQRCRVQASVQPTHSRFRRFFKLGSR